MTKKYNHYVLWRNGSIVARVYDIQYIVPIIRGVAKYGTWQVEPMMGSRQDAVDFYIEHLAKYKVGEIVTFMLSRSTPNQRTLRGKIDSVYTGGYRIISDGAGFPVDEEDVLWNWAKYK